MLVSEDEIAAGIRFAYEEEGEVIEGGAAVGIAALHRRQGEAARADGGRALRQEHRARTCTGASSARRRPEPEEEPVMPTITILTEADLRRLVPLDADAVAAVEDAFRALAARRGGHAADPAPRHRRRRTARST